MIKKGMSEQTEPDAQFKTPCEEVSHIQPVIMKPISEKTDPEARFMNPLQSSRSVWVESPPLAVRPRIPANNKDPGGDDGNDESPIFDNEWFKIQRSSLGGWGVFDHRDIPKGTIILVESPLLLMDRPITWDEAVAELSMEDKLIFNSLHWFERRGYSNRNPGIIHANSFGVNDGAHAIFAAGARFNHACPPAAKVAYFFDRARKVMSWTTVMDVTADSELTITYHSSCFGLWTTYNFVCQCGHCLEPLTGEEKALIARGADTYPWGL